MYAMLDSTQSQFCVQQNTNVALQPKIPFLSEEGRPHQLPGQAVSNTPRSLISRQHRHCSGPVSTKPNTTHQPVVL